MCVCVCLPSDVARSNKQENGGKSTHTVVCIRILFGTEIQNFIHDKKVELDEQHKKFPSKWHNFNALLLFTSSSHLLPRFKGPLCVSN